MVNRLKGRGRGGKNKASFIALDSERVAEIVVATHAGRKWRAYEDAVLIAAGAEESVELDAALAAQLGRTPSAVRARRAKLKKMGRL